MVSFQCEVSFGALHEPLQGLTFGLQGCGDVQTKKKLDSHRNQCHAPFTCIDCMTTFHKTEYRAHTVCLAPRRTRAHAYTEMHLVHLCHCLDSTTTELTPCLVMYDRSAKVRRALVPREA